MAQKEHPTVKNTKNEILAAYNELLKEVAAAKSNKSEEQQLQSSKSLVQKVSKQKSDYILHHTADLKLQVTGYFEKLGSKLLDEKEKLDNLQNAIAIEENRLKEMHDIIANANSLEALLLAQQKKKAEFEEWIVNAKEKFTEEMQDKKKLWNKEQSEYEAEFKEKKLAQKKEWEREEEEYKYKQKITRQKDTDEYLAKKSTQERELAEKRQELEQQFATREADIIAKEQEFAELKESKNNFDKILQEEIKLAKESLTKELANKFDLESTIRAKESHTEISLLKQNIKFLEEKVKDQNNNINYLNKQLVDAQIKCQDLAKKVIEGNTRIKEIAIGNQRNDSKSTKELEST